LPLGRFPGGSKLIAEFDGKSQLVILRLQLGRLQKAANLRTTLDIRSLGVTLLLLLLKKEQLGVVASELSQGDEEVTQV
jgi:hypothetical protein